MWIGFWWDEDGIRRAKTLGSARELTRGEAETKLADLIQPINAKSSEPKRRQWTLKAFIEDCYFPFSRRHWKKSTAETTEDRIRYHLIGDLGKKDIASFRREYLQLYLDGKTKGKLSFSTVSHLRWDLRAIFRLAQQDGVITNNPADTLFVAGAANVGRKVLDPKQVQQILSALELREQVIVRLAVFSGMRPGEILALQWKHVHEDHVLVEQRTYKGHIDTPKTERGKRQVAISPQTHAALDEWKAECSNSDKAEAWVFPSENENCPMRKDNIWRRVIEPRLGEIKLKWATFQVMRRTHASLSRIAGVDPKLVADQLGHGLGVSLDVYTIAGLDQRLEAVNLLEQSLVSTAIN